MNKPFLRCLAGLSIAFGLNSSYVWAISPVLITNVMPNNGFGSLVISGNYLYSVGDAFRVFDISNPANPGQVGTANLSGGGSGLVLSGNHAFVLEGSLYDYFGASLSIFDVSNPVNPSNVGQILPPNNWFAVAVSGQYVYLGGGVGPNGYLLQVYDASNPTNPVSMGQVAVGPVFAVAQTNNYAFLLDYNRGLLSCDLSDSENPKIPQQQNDFQEWGIDLYLSGGLAYIASGTNGLIICDISDPTNHSVLSHIVVDTLSLTVSGNYAYCVNGSRLSIVDVSSPLNATVVFQNYETDTASYQQGHIAAVKGNYLYVSTVHGLRIYTLGIAPPSLSITSDATTILLSWPTPTGEFAVQQSPDLDPRHWTTLTNAPFVVGGQNQVNIPKTQSCMFYRLISQ